MHVFYSSRRRHTRWPRDWSSDVCSSDLSTSEWNYGRWVNDESDSLLEDGLSEDSFDEDYRQDVYVEWQKVFNEELPGLPLWENLDLYGINERVEGVTIDAIGLRDFHEWYVTE